MSNPTPRFPQMQLAGHASVRAHVLGTQDPKAVPFGTITQAQEEALNAFIEPAQLPAIYSSDYDLEDHTEDIDARHMNSVHTTTGQTVQDGEHSVLRMTGKNKRSSDSDQSHHDFTDYSGYDAGDESDTEIEDQPPRTILSSVTPITASLNEEGESEIDEDSETDESENGQLMSRCRRKYRRKGEVQVPSPKRLAAHNHNAPVIVTGHRLAKPLVKARATPATGRLMTALDYVEPVPSSTAHQATRKRSFGEHLNDEGESQLTSDEEPLFRAHKKVCPSTPTIEEPKRSMPVQTSGYSVSSCPQEPIKSIICPVDGCTFNFQGLKDREVAKHLLAEVHPDCNWAKMAPGSTIRCSVIKTDGNLCIKEFKTRRLDLLRSYGRHVLESACHGPLLQFSCSVPKCMNEERPHGKRQVHSRFLLMTQHEEVCQEHYRKRYGDILLCEPSDPSVCNALPSTSK